MAIALISLLGLQSIGPRVLALCACKPSPQVMFAELSCCDAEGPAADVDPAGGADEPSGDCVDIRFGLDDTVLQIGTVVGDPVVVPPRWSQWLPSSRHACSARLAVLPRPPPLRDPTLLHLATVRLTM